MYLLVNEAWRSAPISNGVISIILFCPPCSVCFKGSAGDEAVLCTDDNTYAVKNVETTNLVLLMQGAEQGMQEWLPLSGGDR